MVVQTSARRIVVAAVLAVALVGALSIIWGCPCGEWEWLGIPWGCRPCWAKQTAPGTPCLVQPHGYLVRMR